MPRQSPRVRSGAGGGQSSPRGLYARTPPKDRRARIFPSLTALRSIQGSPRPRLTGVALWRSSLLPRAGEVKKEPAPLLSHILYPHSPVPPPDMVIRRGPTVEDNVFHMRHGGPFAATWCDTSKMP